MRRYQSIGVLTGGGDCPGLNAVIRSVVKTAIVRGYKIWGIKNGFSGLVKDEMTELRQEHVSGILPRGGTILGTTNRDNPFHYLYSQDGATEYRDMSLRAVENLRKKDIDTLIVIGGDGTLRIANDFRVQYALPVVGIPKTIDNDLPGTERTFGFDTAVSIATEALDRLHTTAESHHRVMILEVMGRYAGWIALHSGLAGGADCILIPEIPFQLASVIEKIRERRKQGKLFSIIVVAEGSYPVAGAMTVARIVEGSPEKIRLGGVGNKLAQMIEEEASLETRCTVLGHLQRGGSPTAYDRILASRYGVAAVEAIDQGETGCMMALKQNRIVRLTIEQLTGQPYTIPLDNDVIQAAKSIGISFGDD
jgi:6-phosphofructokinase 1